MMQPLSSSIAARLALCSAIVALTGCAASSGGYPSLAPRSVETIQTGPVVAVPSVSAPRDAALDAQATTLLAAAREAAERFEPALAVARRATAAAGAPGSESWVAAQQEVTRLERARSPFVSIVADLDALRLAQAQRSVPADLAALDAAWAEVSAIDAAHADALSALVASLPHP